MKRVLSLLLASIMVYSPVSAVQTNAANELNQSNEESEISLSTETNSDDEFTSLLDEGYYDFEDIEKITAILVNDKGEELKEVPVGTILTDENLLIKIKYKDGFEENYDPEGFIDSYEVQEGINTLSLSIIIEDDAADFKVSIKGVNENNLARVPINMHLTIVDSNGEVITKCPVGTVLTDNNFKVMITYSDGLERLYCDDLNTQEIKVEKGKNTISLTLRLDSTTLIAKAYVTGYEKAIETTKETITERETSKKPVETETTENNETTIKTEETSSRKETVEEIETTVKEQQTTSSLLEESETQTTSAVLETSTVSKDIPADNLSVTFSSSEVFVGKTAKIKAVVKPTNTTDTVKYMSSNNSIASVSTSGVITGKKSGVAIITVKTTNGIKVKQKITVVEYPKWIKLSKTKVTLTKGKSIKLKYSIPKYSLPKVITWSCDNSKVASVTKDGVVIAKKKGKAKITIKTNNNKKATCLITVK